MADTTASTGTPQADGEGPEGSDKPPHGDIRNHKPRTSMQRRFSNGMKLASAKLAPMATPAQPPTSTTTPPGHVPLPPPDSHSYPKHPERTRKDLQQLELQQLEKLSLNDPAPPMKKASSSTTGSITPSTSESPSASESESWSLPSTQPPSRAPSFSAGKSGGKVPLDNGEPLTKSLSKTSVKSKESSKTPRAAPKVSPTPSRESTKEGRPKGPPSINSDTGGQKFTLKDLLGAPKLVRRSSARSTGSSKKSGGSDGGRSVAGESTASLLKKYGVCEKVAIGKGATSVVRLAHKWDRSEEKLYAVKVRTS